MSMIEIKKAIDDIGYAFQEFKSSNDERVGKLENDVLLDDKLDKINSFLDSAQEKLHKLDIMQNRPAIGGEYSEHSIKSAEHKKALSEYIRKGDDRKLKAIRTKAIGVGAPESGGHFLPDIVADEVYIALQKLSPMRRISKVVKSLHRNYEMIFDNDEKSAVKWSESEVDGKADPETVSPKLAKIKIQCSSLYARHLVSGLLLDETPNVEQWLIDRIVRQIATEENRAFTNGKGRNTPRGFLSYEIMAKSEFGKGIAGIKTGEKHAFSKQNPEKSIIDLMHMQYAAFLEDSVWMMNRSCLAEVRKLKLPEGQYLWQPPLSADMKTMSILGYPVVINDDMPGIGHESLSPVIAFGNFKEGYLIADHGGVQILRDPYTSKPFIEFYFYSCVGGDVLNPDAIRLLSLSA
ncbi:phage major capsid protein [Candidatus Hydrogenosomobacter endosymbioticus]|uniref:Phage capsid protein n=1 Tax=Candidatus Hydrogenosomobacter endosymbioticus TaxID=2558174 RepID=A0ABM7V826_9PROT|nr:phage major capsid protein [Candidatus Hydrogenosomobacter endosymbioticus]BDB95912.1 phage capsid protein [Candidatus Hydrogenosomobacter endosymbioticus]